MSPERRPARFAFTRRLRRAVRHNSFHVQAGWVHVSVVPQRGRLPRLIRYEACFAGYRGGQPIRFLSSYPDRLAAARHLRAHPPLPWVISKGRPSA
jgi:hypothetical protein